MNSPPHPLTRRSFLTASVLGAAALGTTGCSVIGAGLANTELDPGSITYWNLFGGGDGVRMQQMLDGYRAANPGTTLEAVTLAWGNPYYTKLSLSTVGDQPPHVAVSHLTRALTLVQGDLLQEITPADLERHGMSPDRFNKRAWEAGLVDGRVYSIPIDTHPFVLFYNTDICGRAGLLDSAGNLREIRGPDAFVDALTRIKGVTGKFGATHGMNSDTASPWRFFNTLHAQLGGEVLADNGTRVVLDDGRAGQVLDYLRSLTVGSGLIASGVDYQSAIALFAEGQAGFHLNGEWEITTFQTAGMPFGMTLIPNIFGGEYAVHADSHTLVLPVRAGQDRATLDRSLGFIRSMLDQSLTWAEGGHVPAWQPFATSEAYRTLTPQSNYAAAADAAVYDPPGWYSGSGSNFEIIMGSAIGAVETGQLSSAAALDQMRSKLQVQADTAAPV